MCSRRCAGFSFIELMIVVVIIGLLAGAVAMSVGHYTDTARVNRSKSDIATIVNAVEAFYADKGKYPTSEEGLGALKGLKLANDSWGRPYQYNAPGRSGAYEVICLGADGREGGDWANADITSDDLGTKEQK